MNATTQRPYHRYPGSLKTRQETGDPGHCERCLAIGHIAAHPDMGCGDVGCHAGHSRSDEAAARAELGKLFRIRQGRPRWRTAR